MWYVEHCGVFAILPVTINVFQMTENLRIFIALKVLKRTEAPNVWGGFCSLCRQKCEFLTAYLLCYCQFLMFTVFLG